jgi:hypothetical protein
LPAILLLFSALHCSVRDNEHPLLEKRYDDAQMMEHAIRFIAISLVTGHRFGNNGLAEQWLD